MADISALPFDIIEPAMPPAPPPDYTWPLALGALALLVVLAWAVIRWRRTRPLRLGRRRLAQARQTFRDGALSAREAAVAIADALRTGFGVQQVASNDGSDARWRAFVERLDRLRYQPMATDESGIDALFAEGASWLRGKSPC